VPEKALVVIPTYNEAVNLPQLVPQVLAQDPRIDVLVVDDNSPDGTGALADEMSRANPRVHTLHREGKLGLGTAYITGFKWALERSYDFMFEMDADFSTIRSTCLSFSRPSGTPMWCLGHATCRGG